MQGKRIKPGALARGRRKFKENREVYKEAYTAVEPGERYPGPGKVQEGLRRQPGGPCSTLKLLVGGRLQKNKQSRLGTPTLPVTPTLPSTCKEEKEMGSRADVTPTLQSRSDPVCFLHRSSCRKHPCPHRIMLTPPAHAQDSEEKRPTPGRRKWTAKRILTGDVEAPGLCPALSLWEVHFASISSILTAPWKLLSPFREPCCTLLPHVTLIPTRQHITRLCCWTCRHADKSPSYHGEQIPEGGVPWQQGRQALPGLLYAHMHTLRCTRFPCTNPTRTTQSHLEQQSPGRASGLPREPASRPARSPAMQLPSSLQASSR